MKKYRILFIASTMLLSAGAFFVSKGEKRHRLGNGTTAYYLASGTTWTTLYTGAGTAQLTSTSQGVNTTAKFTTHNGTHTLCYAKSTSDKLYY